MPGQTMGETIERKMREELAAAYVEVIDESWKHAGHAGAAAGGGHFILCVVSERFEGIPLMDRHRMVFRVLEQEMQGHIHALVITAMTPRERGA
jgi:BolA protein